MRRNISRRLGLAMTAASLAAVPAVAVAAPTDAAGRAGISLTQVSTDPYSDSQAQHATEVEPDTFSHGTTIVAGFQVGRVYGGGASNIGWATSTDAGATWTHGFLPNTTANTGGPYGQVSDASVAYDAKDGQWLISWLGVGSGSAVDVKVSRSSDGKTWGNPVTVAATGTFFDKNWTVCDNHSASPYYGHCYTEFDDADNGDAEHMAASTDGGATWGTIKSPADNPSGLGGQPVVQADGTVVVPYSASGSAERAFVSTDGGSSWGSSVLIATTQHHDVAGLEAAAVNHDTLRESPLPSAEVDSSGKVYVVWSDCRFRSNCSSNDIIMSTSGNGTTWSSPTRVPIDAVSGTADHFAPGVGVDPSSSGGSARLGLTYYYYPNADCSDTTCQLDVGFVSSADGGSTWSAATQLAGPMTLAWLPNTSQGRMFGDYISTSVLAGGNAYPVVPVAAAPNGSTFDVAMNTVAGGLPIGGGSQGNTVTVTNPGNQSGTVGTAASVQIKATDSASGQTLAYSATGLPAGLSINSSTGLISGTPSTANTYNVTVTVKDTTGASGNTSFTWTVSGTGSGATVTVTNPGNQIWYTRFALNPLRIKAADSKNLALTFTATGLPPGLTINTSGVISGTATAGGTFTVKVTAKDTGGATGSTTFTFTIYAI